MGDESSLSRQIASVERSVVFLRQEHLTLLHGLHLEILSLQKRCSGEDHTAAAVAAAVTVCAYVLVGQEEGDLLKLLFHFTIRVYTICMSLILKTKELLVLEIFSNCN